MVTYASDELIPSSEFAKKFGSYLSQIKENTIDKIGNSISILVFKKLYQLAKNPVIGEDLGNRANINLSGYKKVYVNNKRVRIVYKIIEEKI